MVAEKGPEQWKFGLILAPLFGGQGRRIKAPNASQPQVDRIYVPLFGDLGRRTDRIFGLFLVFFNQNDLTSMWHYIYESMILDHKERVHFSDYT